MKYPFIQRLVAQGVQVLEVVDSWQLCILVVGNEQVLHPLEMLAEFFTVGFEVNLPNLRCFVAALVLLWWCGG